MSRESANQALESLTPQEVDLLNNSPDLLDAFRHKHQLDIKQPSELQRNISTAARPILEIGGAVGGSALGGGPTNPVGLAGGALGYAAGQAGANLLDRHLGIMEPIQNIPQAMGETAGNIIHGGEMEAGGLVLNPVIRKGADASIGLIKRFLKSAKGIPPSVTKMAIEDPSVMELSGSSKAIQGKSQDIINAVKEARAKVGAEHGAAYAEQGMKSPTQQIIAGEKSAPSKSFPELLNDYKSALDGSLLVNRDTLGTPVEMPAKDKLSVLTELKRSLQNSAVYPPPGQQLSPEQDALNGAIKKMAGDIDALRGKIPGGEKLSVVDDAWHEMTQLNERLRTAFKDPYNGQDYLNRIIKGDVDWLTSGKNAGRIGAIERIEKITGKDVLKPALREIAASYINNPNVMSLPGHSLKSVITGLLEAKPFLKAAIKLKSISSGSPLLANTMSLGLSQANNGNQ